MRGGRLEERPDKIRAAVNFYKRIEALFFAEELLRLCVEQVSRAQACLRRKEPAGAVLCLELANTLLLRILAFATDRSLHETERMGTRDLLAKCASSYPLPGSFAKAVVRVEELANRLLGRSLSKEPEPSLGEVLKLWRIEAPILNLAPRLLKKVEEEGVSALTSLEEVWRRRRKPRPGAGRTEVKRNGESEV